MRRPGFIFSFAILTLLLVSEIIFANPPAAEAAQGIKIYLNGREIQSDVQPVIINDTAMVPIRVISEELGMQVKWDDKNRQVIITGNAGPVGSTAGNTELDTSVAGYVDDNNRINENTSVDAAADISITGSSLADSEALKSVLRHNNPNIPENIVDLYLQIGQEYGIRGDIAFCQAAKETGWWKFGGLVKPYQNNYCGLSATGTAATGEEDLRGAAPSRVMFQKGVHGAIFDSPATGVEAHIQHLYAYATVQSLPVGKELVDPRFKLISRGIAKNWSDLDGKWAVPGNGYGQSIIDNYYRQALILDNNENLIPVSKTEEMERENKY